MTATIGLVLGVVAFAMVVSWVVARFTEDRTPAYRAWLTGVVNRFSTSKAAD